MAGIAKSRGRFGSTTAGTTNTMPTVRSAWNKSSGVSAAWSGKAAKRGAMYQRATNAKTIRFSADWRPKIWVLFMDISLSDYWGMTTMRAARRTEGSVVAFDAKTVTASYSPGRWESAIGK